MASNSDDGVTNDATDVTMVAAPAASTTRMVPRFGLKIYNADTKSATVTVQKKQAGTAS